MKTLEFKLRPTPPLAIRIRRILEWIHIQACRHEDYSIFEWEPFISIAQTTDALLYPHFYAYEEDEGGPV